MFEWDPRKAQANGGETRVSFDEALTVFLDANALDGADPQHSTVEKRYPRLARSAHGRVPMVADTLRRSGDAETIRLSARRASRRERAAYRAKDDYSDIPESSPEELKAKRQVGRPPLGDEPRRLIAIGVDPSVLESFHKEARRRHVGYQTLINEVLAEHIRNDAA